MSTSSNSWFYAQGGQSVGPVSVDTLRQMVAAGRLRPSDLVWREGMTQWATMSSIRGFLPAQGPAPAHAHAPPPAAAPQPAAPQPVAYYTPAQYTGQVVYAGFWLRFCAAFIDGLITGVAGAVVGFIADLAIGLLTVFGGGTGRDAEMVASVVGQVLGIVINWLYGALMESSSKQATLGKMALGIKVTSLEGGRISFGRATGRHFAKFISAIILLIGYIMAGFTEKKQALHDMIAGTLVVKK